MVVVLTLSVMCVHTRVCSEGGLHVTVVEVCVNE